MPSAAGVGRPSDVDRLLAYDRDHVWHPYAPALSAAAPLLVESASGVRLRLSDGRDVIDGMASWWCAIHGYRHPALDEAVRAQLARMSHVMFGGLTHEPAIGLAERLVSLAPAPLDRVFFCDSGSVAVEVAVKMCLQYQYGAGRPGRHRLLALRGAYHGDTFAAMSLCDPVQGMHHMFAGALPPQVFAPRPPAGFDREPGDPELSQWAAGVRALVERHAAELAGIVVEPVLQGAGGMYVYAPHCLGVLRELADEHDLPLVFDEVATGFGRTGTLFALEHAGVTPDVLCLGKALTGGYVGLAAVLTSTATAGRLDATEAGAFMHGPTFMGNPLACAVAAASVDVLLGSPWQERVRRIESLLGEGLAPARGVPGVRDVRVLGAVGVVELDRPVDVALVTSAALERGVWLRPFGRLVYTMPPYVCTDDDVRRIAAAVVGSVEDSQVSVE